MSTITTWNPFREMDDVFTSMRRNLARELPALNKDLNWAPAVDIVESAQEYLVKAELPGVNKDDVKITIDKGLLTLSGERKLEQDNKDKKQHRIERFYGTYARSFSIPDDVAADRIAADYKDGVLCIHLPKTETRKAQAVEVKVQ